MKKKALEKYQPGKIEAKWPHSAKATRGKHELGKYLPTQIESKWQEIWREKKLYEFKLQDPTKPTYYNLVELPYPSGDLHLGHWFSFTIPDAHARYKRMNDIQVFFPNGFDAFGLPAENAAIKRNIHPKDWTMSNIQTMRGQFETMGTMIDWSHQAITCEPEYYRWNQWIFQQMFEKGVAYRGKTLSNWCPVDQTVLANEHVEDGKCWRCGSVVEQKEVEQWFLKITDYADRLLWENTDEKLANGVDWPKSVREGQNNWIGRSEGLEIDFPLAEGKEKITVFTVYPETIFGVTYMVLAPEHPLAEELATPEQKQQVTDYIKRAQKKTEMERKTIDKDKTGVFTGSYVKNPVNGAKVPVWLADYVIAGYGTGAVMGVPGSDQRDFAFAKKYDLPIVRVIGKAPSDTAEIQAEEDVLEEGYLVNSAAFSGLETPEPAREKLKQYLEEQGFARRKTQYHLHDWSVSRQRYWGTPVPMIHCEDCGIVPVPEKDLPVELPYQVDYTPKGKPPLASAEDWLSVKCPKCGKDAKRDAETLDTFFDSSWYFYRYVDPKYDKKPFNTELASVLTPVDIYFGGAEHTLGHTLYARFFTKFFHDRGLLSYEEFAKRRIQHGVILGPDGHRMSKSRGNVVNPDDVVREYGADTVRLYLSFMMPYEATAPWSVGAISGIYRFLKRIWDLSEKVQFSVPSSQLSEKSSSVDQLTGEPKTEKLGSENRNPRTENGNLSLKDLYMMHKTIKKVGEDLESIKFNTAVAAMMEWLNYLSAKQSIGTEEYVTLLKLLAPFAPHITEELWSRGARSGSARQSIHLEKWPAYDPKYLQTEVVNVVVQVNGKVRANLEVDTAKSKEQRVVEEMAKEHEGVKRHIEGKTVKHVVYVPGKIINFVTE